MTHYKYIAAFFYGFSLQESFPQLVTLLGEEHARRNWKGDGYFDQGVGEGEVPELSQILPPEVLVVMYDDGDRLGRMHPFLSVRDTFHYLEGRGEGWGDHCTFPLDQVDTAAWDAELEAYVRRTEMVFPGGPPTYYLEIHVPAELEEPTAEFYYSLSQKHPGHFIVYRQPALRSTKKHISFPLPMVPSNTWDVYLKQTCATHHFHWLVPEFHLLLSYIA